MKYNKKIVGERIYLSPMSLDDAEKYLEWFCDRNVTDGLGVTYFQNTYQSEYDWLEENLKKQSYQFAIVRKKDDILLGNLGFEAINQVHRTATVGIFIGDEENRNKGYGTEALMLSIGYAFDVLNLNNIMLNVYDFNERAVASYKKVGFKEFGRRRQAYYLNNEYYDIIHMDIIRDDWYRTD